MDIEEDDDEIPDDHDMMKFWKYLPWRFKNWIYKG